jgi:glycosyltransferase 2 family protein
MVTRQRIIILIKYLFGITVLFLVYKKAHDFDLSSIKAVFEFKAMALLFFLKVFSLTVVVFRWRLTLKRFGLKVNFAKAYELTLIGFAMNYVTPGSLSGDLIKGAILERREKNLRKVSLSILLDRVSGLFSVLAILVFSLVGIFFLKRSVYFKAVDLFGVERIMIGIGIMLIVGMGLILTAMFHKKTVALIKTFLHDLSLLKGQWINICLLSVLSQLSLVTFCYVVCQKIGFYEIDLLGLMFVFSFASLAIIIPISPGGLGVGQVIYSFLMSLYLGAPTAAGVILFSCFQIFDIALIIPGLICFIYVLLKKETGKRKMELEL